MNAIDLIKANRLTEAKAQLTEDVKASPADSRARTLLFQVLSFSGEWEKAERHLDIMAMRDSRAEIGVQVYKDLICAERERSGVYDGNLRPSFMTGVPPYLDMHFFAWEKLKSGNADEAAELFSKVESATAEITGTLDGNPFKGFRNVDSFISAFLEVFVHDHYLWVPFTSLRELSIPVPGTLMELLWTPARITTMEGLTTNCFLPVTYHGSAANGDDMARLGKITDWRDMGGGFYKGIGQQLFQIGNNEIPLLEIRELQFANAVVKRGTEIKVKRKAAGKDRK